MYRVNPQFLKRLASTGKKGAIAAAGIYAGQGRSKYLEGRLKAAMVTPPPVRRKLFGVQTPKSSVARLRKMGASSGQMRGFFRRGRKYKRGRRNRFSRKGINLAKEYGGIVTATKTAYVGHCDMPLFTIRKCVWRAIFKRMYEKMYSFSPDTLHDPIIFTAQEYFNVVYKRLGVTQTESKIGPATIEEVADFFASQSRGYNSTSSDDVSFLYVEAVPTSLSNYTACRIRLLDLTVTISSKSSLKLQNRTINSVGQTEADEVDNVPLSGYYYGGVGQGAVHKIVNTNLIVNGGPIVAADIARNFRADDVNGVVAYAANSTALDALKEPPLPGDFSFVARSGKARFNPGDLRTSNLSSSLTREFNKLYSVLRDASTTLHSNSNIGKYRFFGLEKMIETNANESAQASILIAYEQNMRIFCSIKEKYTQNTVQLYEFTGTV